MPARVSAVTASDAIGIANYCGYAAATAGESLYHMTDNNKIIPYVRNRQMQHRLVYCVLVAVIVISTVPWLLSVQNKSDASPKVIVQLFCIVANISISVFSLIYFKSFSSRISIFVISMIGVVLCTFCLLKSFDDIRETTNKLSAISPVRHHR